MPWVANSSINIDNLRFLHQLALDQFAGNQALRVSHRHPGKPQVSEEGETYASVYIHPNLQHQLGNIEYREIEQIARPNGDGALIARRRGLRIR